VRELSHVRLQSAWVNSRWTYRAWLKSRRGTFDFWVGSEQNSME